MAQKKPTTPFEQHSSSDDEEEVSNEEVEEEVESESEEEEPKKPDPKPDSSSEEDGSDSGSDEEEEEEEEVTPVKPVVVVQSPKVREKSTKKQQPDLASASAVTVGKKRPGESSKAAEAKVSKKLKKVEDKRVAEDVVKKVEDYPKTPLFQRLFSEDDEIAMLNALFDYSAKKCIDPIEDIADFHDFVKKSIHIDVTSAQLSAKIRKMKSKYKKNASKPKETFGKPHDQSCYDLSKKIWEKSSSACAGSELKTNRKRKRIPKTNMTPVLQIPQVVVEEPVPENISLSELAKTIDVAGMMCLSNDTFKKVLELLSDDEARAAFEDKWKNMLTAELELTYKRLELSRGLMKLALDALGHRGS